MLEKFSRENFREFPGSPEKFSVSRVVENPRKRETLRLAISRTFFGSANGSVLLPFSNIGPLTSRKTIINNPLSLFIFNDTLKRFNFAN